MSDPTQLPLFDPIQIPLAKGGFTLIDPIDADLAQNKWRKNDSGYAVRKLRVGNKRPFLRMHRVIMARIVNRDLTQNEKVDHIDGNPLNNCRSNLRIVNDTQNAWNSRKPSTNTSGFKGAALDKNKGKWLASIRSNGKHIFLGYFDTPEAAHEAYCVAARKYRGEYARID